MRRRNTLAAAGVAAIALVASTGANGASKAPGQDQTYLTTAIQGDRFEIDGGNLALKQSQDPSVQKLAKRLVKDHSMSLGEAEKLARGLNIKIPGSPTPPQQWELHVVQQQTGKTFDQYYASLEVADHKQDIEEATHERDQGSNAAVRAAAAKELPTLNAHLKLARATLTAVGG